MLNFSGGPPPKKTVWNTTSVGDLNERVFVRS